MRLALYVHPFDLAALAGAGGLARLADLGFAEVALAASYHDGRWLSPWHPGTRVRFLEDGTVHFRAAADYGRLRPLANSCVPAAGPSPLAALCDAAPRHRLAVRAWSVFTHNTRLGAANPDLCVENAFGDRYVYALCPAQPEVQRYVLGLARDVGAHAGLRAIELEAFGWMGWKHGSHHDKASFQPKGLLEHALSLCFCAACRAAAEAAGVDIGVARSWARSAVTAAIEHGCALEPSPAADEVPAVAALRAVRAAVLQDLGARVRAAVPATVALAAQVHPDPRFAGSQLPAAQADGLPAAEFVVTAYGDGPAEIARTLAADGVRPRVNRALRLSIWPKAPQFTGDEDLVKVRDLAARAGVATIAIYHLGLLPWRTIERAARVLEA